MEVKVDSLASQCTRLAQVQRNEEVTIQDVTIGLMAAAPCSEHQMQQSSRQVIFF